MAPEVRTAGGRRLVIALVVSLAAHALLVLGVSFIRVPRVRETPPPGDAMMVELQKPDQVSPPPGPPGLRQPPGAPKAAQRASRPSAPERPRTATRVAPPAPNVARAPVTPPAPVSRPLPEPPKVASAAPAPTQPGTHPSEPATPASPVARPAEGVAESPHPAPTREPSPAAPSGATVAGPRVASVPSDGGAGRPSVDIRKMLRGGGGGGGIGGGGRGGRAGIEGEPIPLDSPDPQYRDYLERLRQMIQSKMAWPCARPARGECEDKDAELLIEFGILNDGQLGFVDLRQSSGMAIYDQFSANAIRLASPFPAPPRAMLSAMKAGSTGVAIVGHFIYSYEVTLRSYLR